MKINRQPLSLMKFYVFARAYRWWMLGLALVCFLFAYCLAKLSDELKLESTVFHLEKVLGERSNEIIALLHHKSDALMDFVEREHLGDFFNMSSQPNLMHQIDETVHGQQLKQFRFKLNEFQNTQNIKEILFISLEGKIIYSHNSPEFIGVNLDGGSKEYKILTSSFKRVQRSLTPDISEFDIVEATKSPMLFQMAPAFSNHQLVGYVAIVIDNQEIFDIVGNYFGLGETGEVVLGKNIEDLITLVAPTRKTKLKAFKTGVAFDSAIAYPIRQASSANPGSGIYTDYAGDSIFATYGFIPEINLGIVVKQDIEEIKAKTHPLIYGVYVAFFLACLFFLFSVSWLRKDIEQAIAILKKLESKTISNILVLCMILSGASIIIALMIFNYNKSIDLGQRKIEEEHVLTVAQERLTNVLKSIEEVGNAILEDFYSHRLTTENLTEILTKEINDNPIIKGISIAYKPFKADRETELFAPYLYRENGEIVRKQIEDYFDYTHPESSEYSENYQKALQPKGKWAKPLITGTWSQPFLDPVTNEMVVIFTYPLRHSNSEPEAAVSVAYSLDELKKFVSKYEVGVSSYFMIVSRSGEVIYHVVKDYLEQAKNIRDIAKQTGADELKKLAKQVEARRSGFLEYTDPATNDQLWVHYQPVDIADWTIAKVSIFKASKTFGNGYFNHVILLFALVIIFQVFLAFYAGGIQKKTILNLRLSFIFVTLILLFNNGIGWYFLNSWALQNDNGEHEIADMQSLTIFKDEQDLKARRFQEKVSDIIPTGVFVESMEINATKNTISINAKVWQQYHKEDVDKIQKGFNLPDAASSQVELVYEKEEGDSIKLMWHLKAELNQNFDLKYFPFDAQTVKLIIEPIDVSDNLLLIPDLDAYRFLLPSSRPGLADTLSPSGYFIAKSYFSYINQVANVDYGVDYYEKSKQRNVLSFNVVLKRNIVDSVIVYLLPLLVILVILFFIVIVAHKWLSNALSAITALTFTIVLLHRSLRQSLVTSEVFYVEYFFFATYLMILLSVIYSVMLYLDKDLREPNSLANVLVVSLYWPTNLMFWLISTIMMFLS